MSQLVYFHSSNASTLAPSDLDLHNNLVWTTCRRQLIFSLEAEATASQLPMEKWQQVDGFEAEALLIEILCGLHSPVVAETEILGQFRDFVSKNTSHAWMKMWFPRIQLWLAVVKEVREKHLCGTGSQSYGSYLRKELAGVSQVDFLGAGSLVKEILPWLSQKQIRLHVRDTEKVKTEFPFCEISPLLGREPVAEVLVIAAPLSHEMVENWVRAHAGSEVVVFDFRRDSRVVVPEVKKWIDLDQIMACFESQRAELELKVRAARKAIEAWRAGEFAKMQIRPFGWEDLCG
jgi:glutamyl-tRNA reductase